MAPKVIATTTTPPLQQQTTMALDVTVVSVEEVMLPARRALGGGAYAVVHTASSAVRTRVDEDGDCNGYPHWGEPVRVALPAGARGLDVEICRAPQFGGGGRSESVAAARVPVEDFTVGPPGHLYCLSYRLFEFDAATGERRRYGVVNITVKRVDDSGGWPATGKAVGAGPGTASGSCCGAAVQEGKPAGFPVGFSRARVWRPMLEAIPE